jgi:hypothetical protein
MTTFTSPDALRRELRQAGISNDAITAAWPEWWSDEALGSPSAEAELRFTLARNLGLSATALLHEEPRFVWRGQATFKRSTLDSDQDEAVLTSFGHTVGRLVAAAASMPYLGVPAIAAARRAILNIERFVSLGSLMSLCWGIGLPIVYQHVFPLAAKRMDAMTVSVQGRPVILLARKTDAPAFLSFTIAHELGHIASGHLTAGHSIIDIGNAEALFGAGEDPFYSSSDDEEGAANAFAFELLTGDPAFSVTTEAAHFNPGQVAQAVLDASSTFAVDPGLLALSLGHSTGDWASVYTAMRQLGLRDNELAERINVLALRELDLERLGAEGRSFLLRVIRSTTDADA